MRLGVLDVGSNTVHLLVVDAHLGAHPWPAHSQKSTLRLAERIGRDGKLSRDGADALVLATKQARAAATELGTEEFLAFATSAVRDAANSADVLARVRKETGVDLQVLSGTDEARLTFLAVRRWFGWSAGRLLVLDIGGGSLEVAAGIDEDPGVALSLPLGAGRMTRRLTGSTGRGLSERPPASKIADLTAHIDAEIDSMLGKLTVAGWDKAVCTSKTFRTLARLSGAAPSAAGVWVPRTLSRNGLVQVLNFIKLMAPAALSQLEGVSVDRAHQLLAGALVAESAMRKLELTELALCPWALREGVILRQLDVLKPGDGATA
jgi:exopolyphosphatase/guanosine-5'-triphosphate,3'-diphosphate pyrophosphatase